MKCKNCNGEITTECADKNRKAPILKNFGPRFIWSKDEGMHVLTESKGAAGDRDKVESHKLLAEQLFSEHPAMHYSDVIEAITKALKKSIPTSERRIRDMLRLGVIKKSVAGLYTKGT